MGKIIKASSIATQIKETLRDVKSEFNSHEKAIAKNSVELRKLNTHMKNVEDIQNALEEKKMKELEGGHDRWVERTETALKLNPEDLLKKLNIL